MFSLQFGPPPAIGGFSLVVLGCGRPSVYGLLIAGSLALVYVVSAGARSVLNIFFAVVQTFQKVEFFHALAPGTQVRAWSICHCAGSPTSSLYRAWRPCRKAISSDFWTRPLAKYLAVGVHEMFQRSIVSPSARVKLHVSSGSPVRSCRVADVVSFATGVYALDSAPRELMKTLTNGTVMLTGMNGCISTKRFCDLTRKRQRCPMRKNNHRRQPRPMNVVEPSLPEAMRAVFGPQRMSGQGRHGSDGTISRAEQLSHREK